MAEKDKNRAVTERAQAKAPAAVAKLPQKPRAKTAYQVNSIRCGCTRCPTAASPYSFPPEQQCIQEYLELSGLSLPPGSQAGGLTVRRW